MLGHKWNFYVIRPPLEAPGTLWKRGQKDCKSQKSRVGIIVTSEHDRTAVVIKPLQPRLPTPDMHKIKPAML